MKSTLVIYSVLLIVGIALGALGRPAYTALRQQQQLAGLATELELSFDRCKDLPSTATKACADGVVLEQAVRTQNKSLCSSIVDLAMQASCVDRINLFASLGNAGAVCAGISENALCPDAMTLLLATERQDPTLCSGIQSASLFQACSNIVSGVNNQPEYTGAKALNTKYSYGLKCDTTIPECVSDLRTFNTAVRSENAASCEGLAMNADLCRAEVALYAAYTSGDMSICATALSAVQCQVEVTLAKALDAGTTALCGTLEESLREGCMLTVDNNKEKRFEYLNASF